MCHADCTLMLTSPPPASTGFSHPGNALTSFCQQRQSASAQLRMSSFLKPNHFTTEVSSQGRHGMTESVRKRLLRNPLYSIFLADNCFHLRMSACLGEKVEGPPGPWICFESLYMPCVPKIHCCSYRKNHCTNKQ